MAENKMEAVAQLFGKELGTDFYVKYKDFSSRGRYEYIKRKACFTEKGLYIYWYKGIRNELLGDLIIGDVVIVDD